MSLDLHRLAEALALQAAFPDQLPALCKRLGTSEGELADAQQTWSDQIAQRLKTGDPSLAIQFANTYGAVERRARLLRLRIDQVQPSDALPPSSSGPRVAQRALKPLPKRDEPANAAANPDVVVPTFMQRQLAERDLAPRASVPLAPTTILAASESTEETAALPVDRIFSPDDPVHPFAQAEPPPASADPKVAKFTPAQIRAAAVATGTEEISPEMAARIAAKLAPVPFDQAGAAPSAERIERVTLEQYAQVVQQLRDAKNRDRVLLVAGIAPDRWQAVSDGWNARLREDAVLMDRWRVLMKKGSAEDGSKK